MGERNPEATVPTADRDVATAAGPKPPWLKPTIRVLKISFTQSGDDPDNQVSPEVGDSVPYVPPSS